MIVVSNTSPINYLILIGYIDLLPELFTQIIIPQAVAQELSDASAPSPVQKWIQSPPPWLSIQSIDQLSEQPVEGLDPGESEAILLAQALSSDLLLLDDMKARQVATKRGCSITGTLGVLDQAAAMKRIDISIAISRLKDTSFWISPNLLQRLIDRHQV
ncbi:MAG: DUF3368 domain-containing protein [Leptolyngbya sp. RL_3_1]|nr:DUF3368 domain-containing protein [Leptolyngbya sp. RL_3_1]